MKQFLLIFSILLSFTVFGQEELRYENRQFYQGEKEITYNEFRDIIKSSRYKFRFLDLQILRSIEGKNMLLNVVIIGGSVTAGAMLGIIPFYIRAASNTGNIFSDVPVAETIIGASIGGICGLLAGTGFIKKRQKSNQEMITDKEASDAKVFYIWELGLDAEQEFKRIIKRYNQSISAQ